jgi:hypothetical protein
MRNVGWIGLLGLALAGGVLGTSAHAAGVTPPLVKVSPGGPRIAARPLPTAQPKAISPA